MPSFRVKCGCGAELEYDARSTIDAESRLKNFMDRHQCGYIRKPHIPFKKRERTK